MTRRKAALGAVRYCGWMLLRVVGYDPYAVFYGSPLRYYATARRLRDV